MKTILTSLFVLLLSVSQLNGQSSGNSVTDLLLSAYSPRNFTTVPVTDQQLDLILKCGIKAPSARNGQPWKFTVIRDTATMRSIIADVLPGNVLIVVSGAESPTGTTPDFDCALATQNMFIAAQGLGLGARIYGSPVAGANKNKANLQIPEGYKVVIVLRVGNTDKSVDAVSSATPRKKPEEIINYKK